LRRNNFFLEKFTNLESAGTVLGGGLVAQDGSGHAELVEAAHGVEVEGAVVGVGGVEGREGEAEEAVDPAEVDAAGVELAGEGVGQEVGVLDAVRAVVLEAVDHHSERPHVGDVGERVVLLGAALGATHVQRQSGEEGVVLERALRETVPAQQRVRLQVENQKLRWAHL